MVILPLPSLEALLPPMPAVPPAPPVTVRLTNYVDAWQQGEHATTPRMAQTLSDHIYDLVALIFGAGGDTAEQASQRGGRAARLALIRREIDRGFGDPDFSLPVLAHLVGVSPRYVQILLEEVDSSFVKEVTERRLQRALELLQSPRRRHLSVLEIAYECGFGTVAHFHRLFRRRYDATPGHFGRSKTADSANLVSG
jgi:AraC-like DNA-binding protein